MRRPCVRRFRFFSGALPLLSLSVLVLATRPAVAQQDSACCRMPGGAPTLAALGRDCRRLRQEAGSACCNRYGSGLHQVLDRLRDSLAPGTPAARVVALMGPPDRSTRRAYGPVAPGPGERLLVYHWRGRHDFLYFVVRRGRVLRRDWYWALE